MAKGALGAAVGFCTADLPTPQFALTANHCVKTSSTNRTTNDPDVVLLLARHGLDEARSSGWR